MPAAKTFHVQTLVQYPREKTEDLVAQATLVNARDVDNAIDGDVLEAMLSQTDNYQCDGGGHGTNGCELLHERAVERVRARLIGGDGGVAVVWRRFHPLVAQDEAMPGKPFEAVDDRGVKLRVEVQEIVESADEINEPVRISTASLQGLRAELQNRQAEAEQKSQIRQTFSMFEDVQVAAAQEQLEDYAQRFRFLPKPDRINKIVADVREQIDQIIQAADEQTLQALNAKPVDANAQANLQNAFRESERALQEAFAPLQKIDVEAKDLLDRQAEIRGQLDAIDTIVGGLEKRRDAGLAGLEPADLDVGPTQQTLHTLLEQATDGTKAPDAVAKALGPLTKAVKGLEVEAERLVARQEALKTAFAARVDRVEAWRTGDGAKEQLLDFVDSGVGHAGFAAPHWRALVEALGEKMADVPKVEDCVYANRKDEARLAKAEKALGPVAELEAQIEADMIRRAADVHKVVEVDGVAINAPSVWVKITKVHPGAETLDVDLHIRNNDVLPVAVGFQFGQDDVEEVLLGGGGRHAKIEYEEVSASIRASITGVGKAGAEAGRRADIQRIDALADPVRLEGDGAVWHVRPADFEAAPEQPKKKAGRLVLEKAEDGVTFDTMKIVGQDGGS